MPEANAVKIERRLRMALVGNADGMQEAMRDDLVTQGQLRRPAHGRFIGRGLDRFHERTKFLKDVIDRLDQPRSVADQAMTARACEAVDRAGHGEDFAVLLHRVLRGRERAAPGSCLDHNHAQAQARDHAVALWV
jgi:hypothetical protein